MLTFSEQTAVSYQTLYRYIALNPVQRFDKTGYCVCENPQLLCSVLPALRTGEALWVAGAYAGGGGQGGPWPPPSTQTYTGRPKRKL